MFRLLDFDVTIEVSSAGIKCNRRGLAVLRDGSNVPRRGGLRDPGDEQQPPASPNSTPLVRVGEPLPAPVIVLHVARGCLPHVKILAMCCIINDQDRALIVRAMELQLSPSAGERDRRAE